MQNNHLENLILGNENAGVQTRRKLARSCKSLLLSKIEPKNFAKPSRDEGWIDSMEEELNEIEIN